jgi:hypothetical protein
MFSLELNLGFLLDLKLRFSDLLDFKFPFSSFPMAILNKASAKKANAIHAALVLPLPYL